MPPAIHSFLLPMFLNFIGYLLGYPIYLLHPSISASAEGSACGITIQFTTEQSTIVHIYLQPDSALPEPSSIIFTPFLSAGCMYVCIMYVTSLSSSSSPVQGTRSHLPTSSTTCLCPSHPIHHIESHLLRRLTTPPCTRASAMAMTVAVAHEKKKKTSTVVWSDSS